MRYNKGFSLLDVLLAIVIFAIGMLALASLQTNLTRSSVDATTRTAASNIGEDILERLRSFRRVSTDPDGVVFAFADIDKNFAETLLDGSSTVQRGGLNYTVEAQVTGYDFNDDKTSVTATSPAVGGALHDFKMVELTISWDNNQAFILDGDTQLTSADVDSGSITIKEVIPSIPSMANALVAAVDDGELGGVIVDYTKGERPDIVAINLEGGRFKESTTPLPEVIRTDSLSETWFDVITYNDAGDNSASFLRREEFLVLSCECELQTDGGVPTLLPTVWNGTEYSDDTLPPVTKNYGVSANNQQSVYCDTCCRDHHDFTGASSEQVFDPSRPNPSSSWSESGGSNGDHKHYGRSKKGEMVEATKRGDIYVEACRMVRKDGYMRVAQDFRLEALNGFAEGYLETDAGISEYSAYVTNAVKDFYATGGGAPYSIDKASMQTSQDQSIDFPGANDARTALPLLGLNSQQLRSRAVYADELTQKTSDLIACLITREDTYATRVDPQPGDPTPGEQCKELGKCFGNACAGITNHLQVLPFYDVQTTWLAQWKEEPLGIPISVTSEAIADENTHSRGLAVLEDGSAADGFTEVDIKMRRGNSGLSATNYITPSGNSTDAYEDYMVYVDWKGQDDGVGVPNSDVWSGAFLSAVNKVETSGVTLTEGGNTFCGLAGSSLSCATVQGSGGSLTFSGYSKSQGQTYLPLYICITEPEEISGKFTVTNYTGDPQNNSATITWPADFNFTLDGLIISIEDSSIVTGAKCIGT